MYNIKKGKQEKVRLSTFFFLNQKDFSPGFSTTKNKFFINSF